MGVPIVESVLDRIFPKAKNKQQALKSASEDIRAVSPKAAVRNSLLAVVREFYAEINRTERTKALGGLGAKLLNLPRRPIAQITLVNNRRRPNLSYTCILPERIGLPKSAKNKVVFAQIEGRGVAENTIWVVTDIRVI
jgi:hypothetical protein